jgi:arylsulfatase A-like enzyme
MDPHSPYLPPPPFERLFYQGDEKDPANRSMEPVFSFKPMADYFRSWMPEGLTDHRYVDAQYDGALAYMDVCIAAILRQLEERGALENTIVVLNGDHGETLYEHGCWYDHHGLYDCNLHVPLMIRHPRTLPTGRRVSGHNSHTDLVPTLLELAGVRAEDAFDGHSLLPLVEGAEASGAGEHYITECTWMRKHGWRTPQWKLIEALEPDFHFKPVVELYDLVRDPKETRNLAEEEPEVAAHLRARREAFIARRERETGRPNPMQTQGDWSGGAGAPFASSQEAYDSLRLGGKKEAQKAQASAGKD